MPLSRPPDRRKPTIATRRSSPGPCRAATHPPAGESLASRAKTFLLRRDRNYRSCSLETAPANDRVRRALPQRHANLPGTAVRTPRCLPYRSVRVLSHTPPAPKEKSQWGSNTFSAAAKALPGSIASFFPSRSQAPPPESAKAVALQFLLHAFPTAARRPASVRTPAKRKSSRTAPSLLRRTNILMAAPFVQVW